MSRTYKFTTGYRYRRVRGRKQALASKDLYGVKSRRKSIPPNQWDDIKGDKQNFIISGLVNKMFYFNGYSLSQIRQKLKDRGLRKWEIKRIFEEVFEPDFNIAISGITGINENYTNTIEIGTIGSDDHVGFVIKQFCDRYFRAGDEYIYSNNKLFDYEKYEWSGPFSDKRITVNRIKQIRNIEFIKIFDWCVKHFEENGMKHIYHIRKWQMGFNRCEIEVNETDPLFGE